MLCSCGFHRAARVSAAVLALACIAAPATANAYQLYATDEGVPLRWSPGPVSVWVDPAGAGMNPHDVESAAWNALATWEDALDGTLEFVPAPEAETADITILFRPQWEHDIDAVGLTFGGHGEHSGELRYVRVEMNRDDYTFCMAEPGCHDLEASLAHELGHAMGMDHEPDVEEATMYPYVSAGDLSLRDLDADDVAGIRFAYLEYVPPSTGGCALMPAGTRSPDGGSPLRFILLLSVLAVWRGRRLLPPRPSARHSVM